MTETDMLPVSHGRLARLNKTIGCAVMGKSDEPWWFEDITCGNAADPANPRAAAGTVNRAHQERT